MYSHEMDVNRYNDGLGLRDNYLYHHQHRMSPAEIDEFKYWAQDTMCSWLEAMVALAERCEAIMSEPGVDNTPKWFWGMIKSMGLDEEVDWKIDIYYVSDVLMRVFHRDYLPNGFGGMFYVPGTNLDMKCEEIWTQAMEYLNQFN